MNIGIGTEVETLDIQGTVVRIEGKQMLVESRNGTRSWHATEGAFEPGDKEAHEKAWNRRMALKADAMG